MKKDVLIIQITMFLLFTFCISNTAQTQCVHTHFINLNDTIREEIIIELEEYLMDSLEYGIHEETPKIFTDTIEVETFVFTKRFLWLFRMKKIDTTIYMSHVFAYEIIENPKKLYIESYAFIGTNIQCDTLITDIKWSIKNRAKKHAKALRKELDDYLTSKGY